MSQVMEPRVLNDTENKLALARSGKMEVTDLIGAAEQLTTANRNAEAIVLYRTWLAHSRSPFAYAVCFNLGVLLGNAKLHTEAEASYLAAIAAKPDFTEAHLNLGSQLEAQGRHDEAVDAWRKVVNGGWCKPTTHQSHYLHALNNIGRLLEQRKKLDDAEQALYKSLTIDPSQTDVLQHFVHIRQKQCTWPVYAELPGISVNTMLLATSPLAMLSAYDDPGLQLLAARSFIERKLKFSEKPLAKGKRYNHRRLRIGYLSGDLCTHAVGLLLADLFEQHDREKFETFAYCSSPEDNTPYRRRLIASIEHFERVVHLSDAEVAQKIAADEIDLLVDLHGLSAGTRVGVLARRPAPVQATYLGFIGTTGLPWLDYVIADRFALPESLAPFFSEKPLYLPHAFLPCDRQRVVGPPPSRAACGLPENAFVFASFNNSYKLNARMFESWMNILKQVEGSVLWLLDETPRSTDNLIRYARDHGVSRDRLVFAPRVGVDQYLARFAVADLFLDNHPYNAGSTAQDALWAGLPMLTLSGRCFVSRMVGSLLNSLGLPELITADHAEYESRACELARDRDKLNALRARLKRDQRLPDVWDMQQFARNLEALYVKAVDSGAP